MTPRKCPVCGRGISAKYRTEPHRFRITRRARLLQRMVRPEGRPWCAGSPTPEPVA